MRQSKIFGANLLLLSSKTLLPALKADSDATEEARSVSRSRAMIEIMGSLGVWFFHQNKISKLSTVSTLVRKSISKYIKSSVRETTLLSLLESKDQDGSLLVVEEDAKWATLEYD